MCVCVCVCVCMYVCVCGVYVMSWDPVCKCRTVPRHNGQVSSRCVCVCVCVCLVSGDQVCRVSGSSSSKSEQRVQLVRRHSESTKVNGCVCFWRAVLCGLR